ncbi:rhodanese-related sulfurtransferase [Enterococcus asini]|uniref:oxygen-dependent tRNA uridine(34) hydroxylase TrhO n=1 Tax=Enterococcus asini TaxID=57732 RepID=UPI00288EC88F|nr:rhodanese-related sulfurtransferase [Enterococcus asini]MDT2757525.1 rhodanese-related sulfurtransferase [Enterococcus asini]
MDYQVLLFYNYTPIENPETFAKEHLAFCRSLNLKGRILVAGEGINGTLSGEKAETKVYMETMLADTRFQDTQFKIDETQEHAFKKLFVRPRKELVALNLEEDINPRKLTGTYLSPSEFRERLFEEDTVVVDARNDYEYDLGHFKGAIRPVIHNFRELPNWVAENKELLAGKKIVTYCTGGIRCEKFSGWLLQEGFEDVAQLQGGIATYGKAPETKGEFWEGAMYVFDERIAVEINQVNKTIIGKDWFDHTPCERYVNCGNPECNRQILCSEANQEKYLGGCSAACRQSDHNRYIKERGWSTEEVAKRLAAIGEVVIEKS